MNLHRISPEYLVMCGVLLQCILDLFHCDLTTYASPLTQPPTENEQATFGDTVDLGITNILTIMESISSATNDQLVNHAMADDPAAYHITSAAQLSQLNDPEYSRFRCEIQCGVRPAHSTDELKRVQTLLPSVNSDQPVVIDCTRTGNSSSGSTDDTPVRVDCTAHYTGRLIHVIVTYDKSNIFNETTPAPVILGDRFAEHIQYLFDVHVSPDRKSATSLYVTLDLPIRTLDAADLTQERLCRRGQPRGSWRPVETVVSSVTQRQKPRLRTRRSPPRASPSEEIRPGIAIGDPWPYFAEKLIHRFEEEIKNFGNDVRRDISWYQTVMNLFIGILAFALLILGATLVAFWIFLRHVIRGKVKPARATL
ncbi:unnamed protein product [Echinostoma caproni]|uniref:ZP domain-containing protein n=1 Tax=Echinostoma caproni TaxID=27848 RepID=A0A183A6Y4_9TREM|nr:unnamed protein product [Echinostoma caproni]